jgi:phosphopantothenoylcysteine synthetase/decarboxylase
VTRPVIVAPAMNTHMWRHPLTPRHIALLRKFLRWRVLMPMIKRLACNEIGQGAMQSIWSITAAVREALGLPIDATLTAGIKDAEDKAAAGVAAAQAEAAEANAATAAHTATVSSSPTSAVSNITPAPSTSAAR